MKCKAKTKNGKQCKAKPMKNGYCFSHNPDKEVKERFLEVSKKGGENRKSFSALDEITITKIDDVPEVTLKILNEIRTGLTDVKTAYAMAYMINVYIKAEELKMDINKVDELEKKLAAKNN